MTPETVPAFEPQPPGMSELSRLTGVFFEPTKAFEDIAARPRWVVPLILTILAGIAFASVLGARIGWDVVIQQQMESRLEKMTPEQRAAAQPQIDMQKKFAPIGGYGGAIFGPVIGYVVGAAIMLAIVAGMMSAPVKFKQIFAIFCYSGMPGILFSVLAIVVMFLKTNPADFNLRNPLMFNAGAFMDPQTSSKFLYAIATSIDVFAIWRILLIATGLKAAGGKHLSFAGALTAVLLPWALLVLIGAAFAGLFG
jgi:hypothetical protein